MCIEIIFFYESSKEISPINFNQQFCCFCSGRRTSKRIYTNSALASGTATGVRLIPDTNAGWIVRKEHPEIYVDIPWFITTYNYIDISWYIHHKSFLAIAWLHTNLPITQRGPLKKRHAYVDGQLHRESYEFLVHVISGPFMILKKNRFPCFAVVVHPPGKIRVQLDHENLFASTACWCQRVRPIGMLMFNDVYSVNLKIWMCMFYWEVHYPGNLTAIGTSPVNYRTQLLKWYIIPLATTSFSIAKCTC